MVPKAKQVLRSNRDVGVNLLFSPQYPNREEASEALLHILHQAPKE
jgi:hypothetical protein